MYFLIKNLRTCSNQFKGIPNSLLLYRNGMLNREYLAKKKSQFPVHPEQLIQKLKQLDANKLCQFFDSDEYKKKVSAFLETQSRILSKGRILGVQYQHVLSCAQPTFKTYKNIGECQQAKLEKKLKKVKARKKGTVINHIMKKKIEALQDDDTKIIKKDAKVYKMRNRTTIMPIFLKKIKKKYLQTAATMQEKEAKPPLNPLEIKRDVPKSDVADQPLYAQILHRSNVYQKSFNNLAGKSGRSNQRNLKFGATIKTKCYGEDPHTISCEGSFFKIDTPKEIVSSKPSKDLITKNRNTSKTLEVKTIKRVKYRFPTENQSYDPYLNAVFELEDKPTKISANFKSEDVLKLGGVQSVGHVPARMSSSTAGITHKAVSAKLCPKKNINKNRTSILDLLCTEPVNLRANPKKIKTQTQPSQIKTEEINNLQMKKVEDNSVRRTDNTFRLQALMEKFSRSRTLDLTDNLEGKNTVKAIWRNVAVKTKKRTRLEMTSLYQKVKMGSSKNVPRVTIKTVEENQPENFETSKTLKPIIVNSPKKKSNEPKVNHLNLTSYKMKAKDKSMREERLKRRFTLNPPFWSNSVRVLCKKSANKSKTNPNNSKIEAESIKIKEFWNYKKPRPQLGISSKNSRNNLHPFVSRFPK